MLDVSSLLFTVFVLLIPFLFYNWRYHANPQGPPTPGMWQRARPTYWTALPRVVMPCNLLCPDLTSTWSTKSTARPTHARLCWTSRARAPLWMSWLCYLRGTGRQVQFLTHSSKWKVRVKKGEGRRWAWMRGRVGEGCILLLLQNTWGTGIESWIKVNSESGKWMRNL